MRFYFTQVPNLILDENMASLTGSEFKVLICICRKTYGFQKKADAISTSQISRMTGISNRHIPDVVRMLEDRKLINVSRCGTKTSVYSINEGTLASELSSEDGDQLTQKVHKTTEITSQDTPQTSEISSHTKESKKEKEKEPPRPGGKAMASDEAFLVTYHLYRSLVDEFLTNIEPEWADWADIIDMIIKEDGYTVDHIKNVIDWAHDDDFWKPKITNPQKLRKHISMISSQMNKDPNHQTTRTPYGLKRA